MKKVTIQMDYLEATTVQAVLKTELARYIRLQDGYQTPENSMLNMTIRQLSSVVDTLEKAIFTE